MTASRCSAPWCAEECDSSSGESLVDIRGVSHPDWLRCRSTCVASSATLGIGSSIARAHPTGGQPGLERRNDRRVQPLRTLNRAHPGGTVK